MTFNTSLMAVCCSRASFVVLKSRTFSIAMTAWSAKVSTNWISFSVKGLISVRHIAITPTAVPWRMSGTLSNVRKFPRR